MKKFDVNYTSEIENIYKNVVEKTREYLNKYNFKSAVLGLSGGLDSTISTVILSDILGSKNVYTILLPSSLTSNESKYDALGLIKNLGVNYFDFPIAEIIKHYLNDTNPLFVNFEQNGLERLQNSYTKDNIQARIRANIIWAVANEFKNTIPIATSDKSESYMGYATINGDMSGGFAPIADVLKTQLFALGKWINKKNGEIIPNNILCKPPMAELAVNPETGKILKAEEALMPYIFMDEVIFRLEELNQTFKDMMNEEFYFETIENITKEQKKAYLEKFAKRTRSALFKWKLFPEIAKINENSLNNSENFDKLNSLLVF